MRRDRAASEPRGTVDRAPRTIRVVVTGSECTGKTTLARALARHYRTTWVPEYVRQYVLEKGAPPEYEDVEAIARGQIAAEDAASSGRPATHVAASAALTAGDGEEPRAVPSSAPAPLVLDTDLLSTVVYSLHYYGDCPRWIDEALRRRAADLYLLAGIDVPWSPDGDQRDRGDRREEMHELFRVALVERGFRFIEIAGSHGARMADATAAIDELIGHGHDRP